jgi:hypothetical protein
MVVPSDLFGIAADHRRTVDVRWLSFHKPCNDATADPVKSIEHCQILGSPSAVKVVRSLVRRSDQASPGGMRSNENTK